MNSHRKPQGEVKSLTIFAKKLNTSVRDPIDCDLNVLYFGHPNMFVNFFNSAQNVIERIFVSITKNGNLTNIYTIFLFFNSIKNYGKFDS